MISVAKNNQQVENFTQTPVEIHGYMMYECKSCGKRVKMFLEKGLEDRRCTGSSKPVPFIILCRECNGMMRHVDWGRDVEFGRYLPLPEGCSYFKNVKNENCGTPIIV